ncbi:MAG: hypothetical protein KDA80_08040 [Planctomycetaceae bacterium]|nr:hypothetical protein [Planctomycetaceae bacterium]
MFFAVLFHDPGQAPWMFRGRERLPTEDNRDARRSFRDFPTFWAEFSRLSLKKRREILSEGFLGIYREPRRFAYFNLFQAGDMPMLLPQKGQPVGNSTGWLA